MNRASDFLLVYKKNQKNGDCRNIVEIQKNCIVSSLRKKGQYKNFCNSSKYS